jgi:hypothetical protein
MFQLEQVLHQNLLDILALIFILFYILSQGELNCHDTTFRGDTISWDKEYE